MKQHHIIVSDHDYQILKSICMQVAGSEPLKAELERAVIRKKERMPADVVKLHSKVEFRDERSGRVRQVELVLPGQANIQSGKMSILSPIGTALLGYREGDVVLWEVPAGKTSLQILKVEPIEKTDA
ncbi:nucleoside diphosphate kinase regulator [Chitinophaga pendula]|uniref:nucleoside diphosphate kinase regulator n=1 Tax=Chitinophaga TaxID=79328 RepID=UPI000BAF5F4D|nr:MULTISPECIES: nucleoside diphosphate kinase regulator [Chitinophaga]ASZ12439.1 transcription elongation factor GreAB [Chitinophaga sp. MD30]UCJ09964.1 nucleoside diphosphate kinase regulator [Chitinophaga pendula]